MIVSTVVVLVSAVGRLEAGRADAVTEHEQGTAVGPDDQNEVGHEQAGEQPALQHHRRATTCEEGGSRH